MRSWLFTIAVSAVSLIVYVIAWQLYLWAMIPRHHAHGVGFYRAWAPEFIVTGALFILFGIYIGWRH